MATEVPVAPPRRSRTLAILSLLAAIAGCVTCGLGSLVSAGLAVTALRNEKRDPARYAGGDVARLALVLDILFVGSLAGFFIMGGEFGPNGPRMRTTQQAANEASAIGQVRSFLSAERAYADAGDGTFGTPACLLAPKSCHPGYSLDLPQKLLPNWEAEQRGFRFAYHEAPDNLAFAVTATPRDGDVGRRAFCGDDEGIFSMRSQGEAPVPVKGRCPRTMEVLK